ncbi:MAG TPA: hypothetical protein VLA14_08500 [Polyangia bacterium]|nr:hypothetical protein [Polyangia bacterium]
MTLLRLRVLVAFGALALAQTYGCDASPISPDGGGADATAGASQATAGHAGGAGTGGSVGSAGHGGGAGATGTAGHAGGAGATGTAGAVGGAGQGGGASCSDLESQYGAAVTAARGCTVSASGQCAQSASGELSACFSNCLIFVNDATALNALKAQWLQAGCANQGVIACPAIACVQPAQGRCVAGDGGGGVCQPGMFGLE